MNIKWGNFAYPITFTIISVIANLLIHQEINEGVWLLIIITNIFWFLGYGIIYISNKRKTTKQEQNEQR